MPPLLVMGKSGADDSTIVTYRFECSVRLDE